MFPKSSMVGNTQHRRTQWTMRALANPAAHRTPAKHPRERRCCPLGHKIHKGNVRPENLLPAGEQPTMGRPRSIYNHNLRHSGQAHKIIDIGNSIVNGPQRLARFISSSSPKTFRQFIGSSMAGNLAPWRALWLGFQ